MKRITLTNLECFDTTDPLEGALRRGHDQDWFAHWFRRLAGCGPTTAANMLLYMMRAGSLGDGGEAGGVAGVEPLRAALGRSFSVAPEGSLERMDYVWGFVTPLKRGGLNSTSLFCGGVRALAASVGLRGVAEALDVPSDAPEGNPARRAIFGGNHPVGGGRPSVGDIAAFIAEALEKDRPVAFLNLDNGAEKQLEKWHWVTVIGIGGGDGGQVMLDILDNCVFLRVDLNRWLETTVKGGGFARFAFSL